MHAPQIVCAGCSEPTTVNAPICAKCCKLSGLPPPKPFCSLCEAAMVMVRPTVLRAENGFHWTVTGGYAGKCAAVE